MTTQKIRTFKVLSFVISLQNVKAEIFHEKNQPCWFIKMHVVEETSNIYSDFICCGGGTMFQWSHVSAAQRRLVLPQHLQSLKITKREVLDIWKHLWLSQVA